MDQIESRFAPAMEWLKNEYVVGVIGIIAICYGSFIAPNLPLSLAKWFDSPIVKVLAMFLILATRSFSPMVSIVLALGLVVTLQTLHRYKVFDMAGKISQMTAHVKQDMAMKSAQAHAQAQAKMAQQPPTAAATQYHQEVANSMKGQEQFETHDGADAHHPDHTQSHKGGHDGDDNYKDHKGHEGHDTHHKAHDEHFAPDAMADPEKAMHPMNRPTWETNALSPRIEDPDDPKHIGWKTLETPNVDVSIYELNPPFLRQNLPNQMGKPVKKFDDPSIYPPQYENLAQSVKPSKGATRYSAYHGYPVIPPVLAKGPNPANSTSPTYNRYKLQDDINRNLPSPLVPKSRQQLPRQFMPDPSLPNPDNMNYDVAARLGGRNNPNYIGAQGLQNQVGYQHMVGEIYGTPNSEL